MTTERLLKLVADIHTALDSRLEAPFRLTIYMEETGAGCVGLTYTGQDEPREMNMVNWSTVNEMETKLTAYLVYLRT